ncbi:MAG: hypothetical protein OXI80_14310 [Caldilineaceae bacterium]|nr:hypothetical protein [Caldilineaceae bacterium]MDE0338839.1 hypothetical protein [Caldilineaceae bacterium]
MTHVERRAAATGEQRTTSFNPRRGAGNAMTHPQLRCSRCNAEADTTVVGGRIRRLRCPACGIEVKGERALDVVREALWYKARRKTLRSSLKVEQEALRPDIEFL